MAEEKVKCLFGDAETTEKVRCDWWRERVKEHEGTDPCMVCILSGIRFDLIDIKSSLNGKGLK